MDADIGNMSMTEKVEAACRQVAAKVIERARQTGTPVIVSENGRIVKRSWEEMMNELSRTPPKNREDDSEHAAGEAPQGGKGYT